MSFGEGDLHVKVDELERRVDNLEAAIRELWPRAAFTMPVQMREDWERRLRALGIEVGK